MWIGRIHQIRAILLLLIMRRSRLWNKRVKADINIYILFPFGNWTKPLRRLNIFISSYSDYEYTKTKTKLQERICPLFSYNSHYILGHLLKPWQYFSVFPPPLGLGGTIRIHFWMFSLHDAKYLTESDSRNRFWTDTLAMPGPAFILQKSFDGPNIFRSRLWTRVH